MEFRHKWPTLLKKFLKLAQKLIFKEKCNTYEVGLVPSDRLGNDLCTAVRLSEYVHLVRYGSALYFSRPTQQ